MGTSKGYIPPKSQEWRIAKSSVTKMVNSNDTNNGTQKAIRDYAKAYSSTHLGKSNLGVVIGNMLDFLQNISENGLNEALDNLGLSNLVDKEIGEIYIGLIDYFCKENSTIEDSVIRECCLDIFEDNNIINIDDLSNLNPQEFILDFIIKYIQVNFEVSFFEKILGLYKDISTANKKIQEVKQYIDENIRYIYEFEEIIDIDWLGQDGITFINKKCRECYDILASLEEE